MSLSIKTAISLEEELFHKVNDLAHKLDISRSKLFVIAAQDFIKKNENQVLLTKINEAYSEYELSDEENRVKVSQKKKSLKNLENDKW